MDNKRVRGISKENKQKGRGMGKEMNIENSSRMINASRAFRNLPPEVTMNQRYDGGRKVDRTSIIGEMEEDL